MSFAYDAMRRRTNTCERKIMAHTVSGKPASLSQQETRQQRKRQAKKEAKMMLKVEAAKKDVQKAEQKVAQAQATLEACRTHLRNLEEKLSLMRATAHASQNGRQATDTYSHSSISTPTDQVIVVSPAEEQSELLQEPAGSDTPSSTPASTHQVCPGR